jgi:hypothetical protein
MSHAIKPRPGNRATIKISQDCCHNNREELFDGIVLGYDAVNDGVFVLDDFEDLHKKTILHASQLTSTVIDFRLPDQKIGDIPILEFAEKNSLIDARFIFVLDGVETSSFVEDLGPAFGNTTYISSERLSLMARFHDGMSCCICRNHFPMALPNLDDGTTRMVCFTCRETKVWKLAKSCETCDRYNRCKQK